MAPINSPPQKTPTPEPKPANPIQDAACLSLYGYQPSQQLLDHVYGRNAPQEQHGIQTPDFRR